MAEISYVGDNPFDEDNKNPFEEEEIRPALPPKSSVAPTLPSKKEVRTSGVADPSLLARAERIRAREEEINRREALITQREQVVASGGVLKEPRPPNWPRCRPLIHHDIAGDMPTPETTRLVKMAYGGWIASFCCIIINVIALLAVLIKDGGGRVVDFILSLVFLIILPIIWFLIYRILYRAARKTRPSLYITFWVFYLFELLSFAFFLIGFPGTGAAGLVSMFQEFQNQNLSTAFILLAISILWGLNVIYCFWIYIASRLEYRKAGGLARAKQDVKDAAIGTAKRNPDLIKQGVMFGAKEAAKHPDIVIQASKAAVDSHRE